MQGRLLIQSSRRLASSSGRLCVGTRHLLHPHISVISHNCVLNQRSMSQSTGFKQGPHKLLVIPGPIEVHDDVLFANAHSSVSHVSPDFIPVFGDCIRMTRDVLFTRTGQPFIIAGSGTLGWDEVASNLVEPGESALVLHSGYFGDSFADCLETYGAKVTQIKAPIGSAVQIDDLKTALQQKKYKVVTVTHVDTSTGVLSDIKAVAKAVQEVSPETLVIVDGVCSVASEEIKFDEWGLDVVLTASQKGLGTPPGLSLLVASERAIQTFEQRRTPVTSYYASWKRWLPIMKAYEAGTAAYFATPPVNLIYAFNTSLKQITQSSISVDDRIRLHREASRKVKEAATSLGLKQLATDPAFAANGMTALYFPDGIVAGQVLPKLLQEDIVVAGGLHKDIREKYFRIGHMGITAVDSSRGDIDKIVAALKKVIPEATGVVNKT